MQGHAVAEQSYSVQRLMDSASEESAPAIASPASAPAAPPPSARDVSSAKAKTADVPASQPVPPPPPASNPARDTEQPERHRPALIYDARVHLAVFETAQAIDAAERLARESGGYLVHRDDRAITFRVPSEGFYAALEATMKLGDVLHREVSVRDVTEEFRDLRVRLRSAEAVRDRLEQLLSRAQKVDEALQVERELERVAAEIEQIKGRLAMLEELTAYSTITLQFQPRPVDQIDSQVKLPFPWLDRLGLSELLQL